eukprot:5498696-Prymnesium_polylepis.1
MSLAPVSSGSLPAVCQSDVSRAASARSACNHAQSRAITQSNEIGQIKQIGRASNQATGRKARLGALLCNRGNRGNRGNRDNRGNRGNPTIRPSNQPHYACQRGRGATCSRASSALARSLRDAISAIRRACKQCNQPIKSTNQPINQPTSQPTNQPTNDPISAPSAAPSLAQSRCAACAAAPPPRPSSRAGRPKASRRLRSKRTRVGRLLASGAAIEAQACGAAVGASRGVPAWDIGGARATRSGEVGTVLVGT